MFGLFKKEKFDAINCEDNQLVAMADGNMIDIKTVSDPMFSTEAMGKTIAFKYNKPIVTLCAPCNGKLTALYRTGHLFGITNENGIEVLVHIGVNTYETKGDGFNVFRNQGDLVKAGEPIVKIDYGKLSKTYDMSTMLIVTNSSGKEVEFISNKEVNRGDVVAYFK